MVSPIEIEGLSRAFGRRVALDQLHLEVPRGCIFGLLGLNGAGKSTTLRILSTLLRPTSGTARISGKDVVAEPREVRARLGIVGEESGRARISWRVGDYLTYFGGLHGLSKAEVRARATPMLGHLGVRDAPRRVLHELSAGNRKKVEIVRALLPRPGVLLLDEPTKDLDIPTKRLVWDFFRTMTSESRLTVLLTSHDPLEISALCSRLAVLREGVKVFDGDARYLRESADSTEALVRMLGQPEPVTGGDSWRWEAASQAKLS